MMAVPMSVGSDVFDLFILLEDENIERIQQHDPAEVIGEHLPQEWRQRRIRNVIVTYCSPEDRTRIIGLIALGDVTGALRFLCRGFRYRPDSGDNDSPDAVISMRTEDTAGKQ